MNEDDTARRLAMCLAYADTVGRILPIDREADRAVEYALAVRAAGRVRRKVRRK